MTEKDYCNPDICTCNHKGTSPVIDADENDIISLTTMKGEIVEKMDSIRSKYRIMLEADLASWQEEYNRLDALLMVHYQPECFGTMHCTDRDYEACSSMRVKACQKAVRAGWIE